MSTDLATVIVLGAGGAYLVSRAQDGGGAVIPPTPSSQPIAGLTSASPINPNMLLAKSRMARLGIARPATIVGGSGASVDPLMSSGGGNWITQADREIQAKLRTVEAETKKIYEQMNADARAAGARKLNDQLKLDPPLDGTETWDELAKIAGGAAGGAAGGLLCGPPCASVGAIIGAYLGDRLEDLIAKHWNDLEAWSERQWNKFKDSISGAVEDVGGAVEDAWDEVTGWF